MATLLLPVAHRRAPRTGRWSAILAAVLAESRPGVQLVFLLRSTAGSGIVGHPTGRALVGIGGWALITIAIYVSNGVSDLATDRANQSRRPIASGRLEPRTALGWCVVLACAGMLACWYVGSMEACLAAAFLLLGWAYSFGPALKNSPSGFAVVIGLGAALTYSAGWVAGGHVTAHELTLALFVSLWVGLCCASKDFSDIDGDRMAGRRTWPVVLGPRKAAGVLSCLAVGVALCGFILAAKSGAGVIPAAVLLAGSIALAITASTSASAGQRGVRRRPYRTFLTTQYATNGAMLALGAL